MKLLVTRPEPGAARTVAALRALGHEVLLAPLARTAWLTPELGAGPWAAVLITSANAARALEIHPRCQELIGLPALAVGGRSAAALRRAGFAEVISADGSAQDLIGLAVARYGGQSRPLLYLAGAERATDLVAALAAAAVPVEMCIVYQAVAQTVLPPEVAGALRRGTLDGVLHFSRRAAESYLAATAGLMPQALAPMHFCLSARTAGPLAAAGAKAIRVATHPDEESLLRLASCA